MYMPIKENWLENFKRVVSSEIDAANGKPADGYRAVAAKTGLGADYIYQIFKGKPARNPKQPSVNAMQAIARAYGEGRPLEWVNFPPPENGGDVDAEVGAALIRREFSHAAIELAALFDLIPYRDRIRRAMAYNAATKAILDVLQPKQPTAPSIQDQKKPPA
jgi:transcriptional regulator with XRE-family HTH domain